MKTKLGFIVAILFLSIACKKKTSVADNPSSSVVNCNDTVNVSYLKQVKPIINANCVRCHDASTSQNFTTYASTKPFAEFGTLEGCITGDPNYTLMPPGNKMDSCSIRIIKQWIKQGYKNN